ncbi:hypothetical protein JYU34_017456 [Plutella xylostella]|uniref:3-dehydrosphinganine reductase n=1 Tax=Plutella xylostella TaxID=51655 RepID=A0ABQ7Q185_PLUXY|nr:hypothetical protein JYU34_017456 [Plutella xylostella]
MEIEICWCTITFAVLIFIIGFYYIGYLIKVSMGPKRSFKDLKNKHVVITGGSSGIGKASALEAAKLGANVTIIGRDVQCLKNAVNEIIQKVAPTNNQNIQYVALDITSGYDSVEKCFSNIEATLGPIFMLINCAGMCICGVFEDMKADDVKHMMDLNFFGTADPTKYVLSAMKKRNEGRIVFVTTEAALMGIYGYSAYGASKWAVRGLAEAINMEAIGTNVQVTVAFPPDTETPGFEKEELTKPTVTKLISGSGGLWKPDDVGKKIVHDAMAGKLYSTFGSTGKMLEILNCNGISSIWQVLTQCVFMGGLRFIMVFVLTNFYAIVNNDLAEKLISPNVKVEENTCTEEKNKDK